MKKEDEVCKDKPLDKKKKTVAYMSFRKMDELFVQQKYIAEKIINDYADKHKIKISEIFVDCVPNRIDLGNKYCLNELMKRVENKEIEQILVPDVHHISRNYTCLKEVLDKVFKNETKIICCSNNVVLK